MVSITIDCEEWNSPLLRGLDDSDNNRTLFSRLGNSALLKLFKKEGIKATFFITGFYAEREKEDVKQILEEGHEIAAHGYEHFYRGRKFNLEEDVKKAKSVLESVTGKKIIGFRAPQVQFSLSLLKILHQQGFQYDSSLHPAFMLGYYNLSHHPIRIHQPIPELDIKEIPLAVMPRTRLPISWMFMRNLGVGYTQLGINDLVKKGICPNLYFHSWEFTKMRSKTVPNYFTRNTGEEFVKMLERLIEINKRKGRQFVKLNEIL